jgi:hypothetical protein
MKPVPLTEILPIAGASEQPSFNIVASSEGHSIQSGNTALAPARLNIQLSNNYSINYLLIGNKFLD